MEIIIKAKQKFNPFFSFLDFGDALNPYYRHILHAISTGAYVPRLQQESADNGSQAQGDEKESDPPNRVVESNSKEEPNESGDRDSSEDDSDDSDGEGYELHPLLRASVAPKPSNTSTKLRETENRSSPAAVEEPHVASENDSAFHAKSLMMVNAAPSLESETASDRTANQYPYGR